MAAGAAPALAVALLAPGLWTAAAAWIVLAAGLMLADALLAPPPRRLALEVAAPRVMGVGRPEAARLIATFEGRAPADRVLLMREGALVDSFVPAATAIEKLEEEAHA